jgi:hypothetical protein
LNGKKLMRKPRGKEFKASRRHTYTDDNPPNTTNTHNIKKHQEFIRAFFFMEFEVVRFIIGYKWKF